MTSRLKKILQLSFIVTASAVVPILADDSDVQTHLDFLHKNFAFQPIPQEGGYFLSTYHSTLMVPGTQRPAGSAIYFLMGPGDFSAMHRLQADEIYHFYTGSPTELLQLFPDGTGSVTICGPNVWKGEQPQIVVHGGTWQGSRPLDPKSLSLLGTTMTPGFDSDDFLLGKRDDLIKAYPKFADKIKALTRQ